MTGLQITVKCVTDNMSFDPNVTFGWRAQRVVSAFNPERLIVLS